MRGQEAIMALFNHQSTAETAPFRERRAKAKVVALTADAVEHVPSPAHALQQMLAERTAEGFITDQPQRRRALLRFVGSATLLWGGFAATLTVLMTVAR